MKILISSVAYNNSIGGIIVLYKLCDTLMKLGFDVGMIPRSDWHKIDSNQLLNYVKGENNKWYAQYHKDILHHFAVNPKYHCRFVTKFDADQDILLVPEIVSGNPFGFKNVVRYVMHRSHLNDDMKIAKTWGNNDFWLYYSEWFYDEMREKNILTLVDYKLDVFKDLNQDRIHESCHALGKFPRYNEPYVPIHPKDSIEMKHRGLNDKQLVELFNKCKRFYSYDTETYLNVMAALCGCESIIVPRKNISKEDVINKNPTFKYGIAYGLDDIESCKSRTQLRPFLEELNTQQIENTKNMFMKIVDHFSLKQNT